MKKKTFLLTLGIFLISAIICAQQPGYSLLKIEPVDLQRADEIAAMLPDAPKGFGEPIQNRLAWDRLYRTGQFDELIKQADRISSNPFPQLTKAIYLDYYNGKDSETSKRLMMKRRMLLGKIVWAECLTNKGKYLPAILNVLNDILNSPSWTFPAEDRSKTNLLGTKYTIGLSSSDYGYEMAQTLYLLDEKLPEELKKQVTAALYLKVFNPTLAAIKNNITGKEFTWMTGTDNHNAVTISGVTGAALAVIKDRKERAVFVTIAERYSNNFIGGYLDDGYCTEGLGYYTYGFGHYALLREQLWQATNGMIDIFKRPKVSAIASFAPKMEIINGVFAAIGDCEQYIQPGRHVMYYVNKNFGLGLKRYDSFLLKDIEQSSLSDMMYFFPNTASGAKTVAGSNAPLNTRDYFENAGVLTVRPFPQSKLNMGATLKGGNNDEHHNHNDIGSFTVVVGNELLMGDPGLATYTPTYFSPQRYTYKTTGSYGHPVPLIAGVQQFFGRTAMAKIITTNFTKNKDVLVMDIASGYAVPALKKLYRSFTYNRSENGYLEIKDEYEFETGQAFETALITRYKWKQVSASEIEITGDKERLLIKIQAPSNSFTISSEEIDEGPKPYTRIAVRLKDAAKTGSVVMTFKPGR